MEEPLTPGRPRHDDPPPFVHLVAHPIRWTLLRLLTESDRAVKELTASIGEPQNLVSYHLRQLRDGGLVTSRHSSADRRDVYYALDIAGCRTQLQGLGHALHPALEPAPPALPMSGHTRRRPRVLFLCTGNSARSQIAEALVAHASAGAIDAASAGSHPKPLHPNAVGVLRDRGIDISANRTKSLDEFRSARFDAVVTLCDRVRVVCPEFSFRPRRVHWSMSDPASEGATDRASYPAFERTAAELETRLSVLVPTLSDPPRRSPDARR